MRCCTEALKHMSKASGGQGGVVVNTASISGLRPEVWGPVYAATKHANVGYTLSWGVSTQQSSSSYICLLFHDVIFKKIVFVFSTGLVRLYIAGLPLRSCPDHWATFCGWGLPMSVFSFLVAAGFEPTSLSLGGGCLNHYPILTPLGYHFLVRGYLA